MRLGAGATNLFNSYRAQSARQSRGCGRDQTAFPIMHQMTLAISFLPEAKVGCQDAAFLGLPIPSLLAVSHVDLLGLRMRQELDPNRTNVVSQVSSGPKRRCAFRSYSDLSVVMSCAPPA